MEKNINQTNIIRLIDLDSSPHGLASCKHDKIIPQVLDFLESSFKIAIQKNGKLTDLSVSIVSKLLDVGFQRVEKKDKVLFITSKDKKIGLFLAKNLDLCRLVEDEYVDIAIIGVDSLIENGNIRKIKIIRKLDSVAKWPLIIATPINSSKKSLSEIKSIATMYPKITKFFLDRLGITKIHIIAVRGSCEGMPFLSNEIDAVVSIAVTGRTLKKNSLKPWWPPITYIYPLIIANNKFLRDKRKREFFKKITRD